MKPNLIIALVLTVAVTLFALLNTSATTVNFAFFQTTGPVALVLVLTFILGVITGSMAGLPGRWKRWREVRSLKKAITTLKPEAEPPPSLPEHAEPPTLAPPTPLDNASETPAPPSR